MKLNKNGRVPPFAEGSSWRYPVTPEVMLRANGYDALEKAIFDFRLRANIPIGDIGRDIDLYYCTKYPGICHPEPGDLNPDLPRITTEPLLNRVSRWVSGLAYRMPKGGFDLVDKAEAESRAAICVNCPQNRGWRVGCAGCSASVLNLLQVVKKQNKSSRDGNLSACQIGGWELASGVWQQPAQLAISEADKATLPENCWRKALA